MWGTAEGQYCTITTSYWIAPVGYPAALTASSSTDYYSQYHKAWTSTSRAMIGRNAPSTSSLCKLSRIRSASSRFEAWGATPALVIASDSWNPRCSISGKRSFGISKAAESRIISLRGLTLGAFVQSSSIRFLQQGLTKSHGCKKLLQIVFLIFLTIRIAAYSISHKRKVCNWHFFQESFNIAIPDPKRF